MRKLPLIALVALAGCNTSFSHDEDAGDSSADTVADAAHDTPADAPGDAAPDTAPPDTGAEPIEDPLPDTAPDFPPDTGLDAPDDVPVDTWIDTGTDPHADAPCTSLTVSLGGECNVIEQCGCAAAAWCSYHYDGESCTAWEECTSSEPPLPGLGEPCDYTVMNSCSPGHACIYDGTSGTCFKWCLTDAECPLPLTCSIDLTTGGCGTGVFSHEVCYEL